MNNIIFKFDIILLFIPWCRKPHIKNNRINVLKKYYFISVKKFRMKILKIIIDTINRYSKLRDFSLSFVLS